MSSSKVISTAVLAAAMSAFLLPHLVCKKGKHEKVYRDHPPVVKIGKIHWEDKQASAQEKEDVKQIADLLARMIAMVDKKDLNGLLALTSKEKGLWIDLKSHKKYNDLPKEISKTNGYLSMFYLDTEQLRAYTGNKESLSVRDLLRYSSTLKADFYMEPGALECELKLFLEDYPDYSYQLNNPVFIKEGDTWKIYRLF